MRKVKVRLNDKEVEAFLVDKIYERKRERQIKNKRYFWTERYIVFYIPSYVKSKRFLVIPQ